MWEAGTKQIFEDIFETARESLLVLDSNLIVLSANRCFYDTFKVTPRKTIGRIIYDLGNRQWDIPKLRTLLEEILKKEKKFDNYEVEHVFPDIGHKIMLLNARRTTHKGIGSKLILLTIEDITERKREEEIIRESEKQYQKIFENAQAGIFQTIPEGRFILANRTMAKMLGYESPEELISSITNTTRQLYVNPEDRSRIKQMIAEHGIVNGYELQLYRKDGSTIWVSTNMYAVHDKNGQILCYTGIDIDITDRKQAEAALQESEQKYRLGFENASDVIYTVDSDYKILNMSPSIEKNLGYKPEEFIGRSVYELSNILAPESMERALSNINKVMKGETLSATIYKFIAKDGSRVFGEISGSPITHKDKIIGFISVARNITDRLQAEEKLLAEKQFSDVVINSLPGVFYLFDDQGRLQKWNKNFEKVSGYSTEEISKMNPLNFFASEDKQRIEQAIQEVFIKGEFTVEADFVSKDNYRTPYLFTGTKVEIGNVKCLTGMGIDITDRKRAEETLQESEQRYRRSFENISDVIYTLDTDLNVSSVSPSVEGILGYKPEDLTGRSAFDLGNILTPESFEQIIADVILILKGETLPTTNYEFVAKDGTIKLGEVTGTSIMHDGKVAGLVAVARDITERKRAEEALQNSEEYFRAIIENALDIIFVVDKKGMITYASPSIERILGYKAEELIGKIILDIFMPADLPRAMSDFGKAIQTKDLIIPNAFRIRHKDGSERIIEGVGKNLLNHPTVAGFVMNVRDITDRKKAEFQRETALEALRKSEQEYKIITDNIHNTVWLTDMNFRLTWISPSVLRTRGYTLEELAQLPLEKNFTPESFEHLVKLIIEQMTPENLKNKNRKINISCELEYRRKDGSTFWSDTLMTLLRDKEGNPNGFLGVGQDITERKKAEFQRETALETLRESEKKYRELYDSLPISIVEIDTKGTVISFNPKSLEIFGYKQEDFEEGMTAFQFFEPTQLERLLGNIQKVIDGKSIPGQEFIFLRKDGSTFPGLIYASSIIQANKIVGIRGAIIDITERKQSENILKESEKKYRELYDFLPIPVFEMDFETNITSANRAIYEAFRGTEEDLKKGFKAWQLLSPEDIDKSRKNIECLLSGDKVTSTEYTITRLDGSVFPAIVISGLVYSDDKPVGLRVAIVDITENKQIEASLKESEERYRALFDRSLDIVYIHDFAGNFIDANVETLKLLGYDREDMPCLNFASLIDSEQMPIALRIIDELKQTGTQQKLSEFKLKCKDGKYVDVETKASVIYRDGKQYAIMGHGRDISERKQAEDDRQQSFVRMRKALGATVQAISSLVETRDPYTAGHQHRVADLARTIATEMGLTTDQIDGMRMSGIVHDLGKISVPSEILSMPRKLTDIEFNFIKTHAQAGYNILKDIEFPWPIARMVLEHHERMDGSGYPNGLTGENILIESRILAIADVVEAMASHRPYRPALGIDAALAEITKNKGVLYDSQVVDACLLLFNEKGYKLV